MRALSAPLRGVGGGRSCDPSACAAAHGGRMRPGDAGYAAFQRASESSTDRRSGGWAQYSPETPENRPYRHARAGFPPRGVSRPPTYAPQSPEGAGNPVAESCFRNTKRIPPSRPPMLQQNPQRAGWWGVRNPYVSREHRCTCDTIPGARGWGCRADPLSADARPPGGCGGPPRNVQPPIFGGVRGCEAD